MSDYTTDGCVTMFADYVIIHTSKVTNDELKQKFVWLWQCVEFVIAVHFTLSLYDNKLDLMWFDLIWNHSDVVTIYINVMSWLNWRKIYGNGYWK